MERNWLVAGVCGLVTLGCMTAHLIPAGYAKCILTVQGPGPKPMHTSFAIHSDDLAAIAAVVGPWVGDTSDGYAHILYSQYSVIAVDLLTDTDRIHDATIVTGDGTAAAVMPPQVTPVVKLSVTARGRGLQGRMFVPGVLAEVDVDDGGNIIDATVNSIGTTFENLQGLLSAGPGEMAVLHYGTHGGTASDVIAVGCEKRTASISKRNRNTSKKRTP